MVIHILLGCPVEIQKLPANTWRLSWCDTWETAVISRTVPVFDSGVQGPPLAGRGGSQWFRDDPWCHVVSEVRWYNPERVGLCH